MANLDRPMGFRAWKTISGLPLKTNYLKLSATNSRIAPNDPLIRDADGYVNLYAGGDVNMICGVATELKEVNSGGTINAYSNLGDILFYAQTDDGSGTLTAATAVGLTADIVSTASGTNKHSLMEIDENSGASGGGSENKALKIEDPGLFPVVDNAYGEWNLLVVRFNRYFGAPATAGI